MKNAICAALVVAGALLFQVPAAYAAECSGSWQVLPNYKPGSGGVCAAIGLNTNQPTCRRGQRFATYCDDASGAATGSARAMCPADRSGTEIANTTRDTGMTGRITEESAIPTPAMATGITGETRLPQTPRPKFSAGLV